MLKRGFDFLVATIGLLLLAPFLLVLGLLVVLESRGPMFYSQARVGKGGQLFQLYKFRSMRPNSDRHQPITIGKRDARVTRVGYYLRKFKLDELPQLFNVWRGDMSLVGPRPELKKFVDLYTARQLEVLRVKPGITDFASIEFRDENELLEGKEDPIGYYISHIMPVKLDLNLKYIQEQSFWTDCRIILRTVLAIF